jgi:hypothetical protein
MVLDLILGSRALPDLCFLNNCFVAAILFQ